MAELKYWWKLVTYANAPEISHVIQFCHMCDKLHHIFRLQLISLYLLLPSPIPIILSLLHCLKLIRWVISIYRVFQITVPMNLQNWRLVYGWIQLQGSGCSRLCNQHQVSAALSQCVRYEISSSTTQPNVGKGRESLMGKEKKIVSFQNSESRALSQWDFGFSLCAAPEFQV